MVDEMNRKWRFRIANGVGSTMAGLGVALAVGLGNPWWVLAILPICLGIGAYIYSIYAYGHCRRQPQWFVRALDYFD